MEPDGFLKMGRPQPAVLPDEQKIALIRKGNALFNEGQYETAKRIFITTGYSDGLRRLGDVYYNNKEPLEALKMYRIAPAPDKVSALVQEFAKVIQGWIHEEKENYHE